MPDAYSWAIRQRVGHGGRKGVLLFMATHATFSSSLADMSSAMIAEALEYSDSSIRKWLDELEEAGLVTKVPQFRADGWQLRNLYRLNVRGSWVTPDEDEEDDSRNLEPKPVKPQARPQPSARRGNGSDFIGACLRIYNEVRAENWTTHTKITGRAVGQLEKLQKHFGDDALEAFRSALEYAKTQDWWTDPKKTFTLANIGSNDKLIEMAEKHQLALQQQEERLFSGRMTAAKAKEIIQKYPEKPVTEEMWGLLSDDEKLKLIKPGQTRVHQVHGPVIIQGTHSNLVVFQKGAQHHEEHIRYFTHEVLPGQVTITVDRAEEPTNKRERELSLADKLGSFL